MTSGQLAGKLHRLWRRAQDLHLEAAGLLDSLDAGDPSRRLALELALHDLLALSARAATLAAFVHPPSPKRREHK